jgi:hypothetical protein
VVIENKNTVNIIIFQAPGDIAYGLDIYRKQESESKFIFLVINVKNVFEFLISLNLKNAQIIFIPYKLLILRNPIKIIKEKLRISNLQKKNFSDKNINEVYFFSRYEDWLTGAFLYYFNKKKFSTLNYCSYYDNSEFLHNEIKPTYRKKIYVQILKYITGVTFKVKYLNKFPEFPIDHPTIKVNIKSFQSFPEIQKEYLYFPKTRAGSLYAIFFLSDCDTTIFDYDSYINVVNQTIEHFKINNISIFIKGHPRLGLPIQLKLKDCIILPSYIPSEFIATNKIKYFIGVETYSLCFFAKNNYNSKSLSLINLIKANDLEKYNFFINYLKMNSDNKILFPTNIATLL